MKKYVCDIYGWIYDEAENVRTTTSPPAPNGKTCPMISSAPSAAPTRIASTWLKNNHFG